MSIIRLNFLRGDNMDEYLELRAEINKQKTLKGLTNADLAKGTSLAESTIGGFMGGKRYSELVDKRLREFLGITEQLKA